MTQEKEHSEELKTRHCICIKTPRGVGGRRKGDTFLRQSAPRETKKTRDKRAGKVYGGNPHCMGSVRLARANANKAVGQSLGRCVLRKSLDTPLLTLHESKPNNCQDWMDELISF